MVDILHAKISNIVAKTSIGKSENGSRILISKNDPSTMSAFPLLPFNSYGSIVLSLTRSYSAIEKIGSAHLVNAGSNNYLGQEDIQNFLRKVAND